MIDKNDRRRWERVQMASPGLAIYYPLGCQPSECFQVDNECQRFVDLIDHTPGGATVITHQAFEPGSACLLKVQDAADRSWRYYPAEVKWSRPSHYHESRCYLAGFAFFRESPIHWPPKENTAAKCHPTSDDYAFLSTIDLLKRLNREVVCPFLNALVYRRVEAGERFVTQGQAGHSCFIIQAGSCGIVIEKNGDCHTIAVRNKGDIIGEMALLTGEPRSAHVDASTPMDLWEVSKKNFDVITSDYPELRNILTEIVARRFATSRMTADRQVGKYLITDIIGRGGFSIVYKGLHRRLDMPVAIKMLFHDMAMEDDFIANFQKEAITIAQFNHENIIKVHDVETCFQTMFIVMELIEGRSLRQILRDRGVLSAGQVVNFMLQVCAGLHYAHQRGIIHQDIKPGNLFVLPDGRLKILDFGLACNCGAENLMTGTPFYMAPEQVECLPVDERTDIYALGLTAFEMLAGRRAYAEDNPHASMELHVTKDIPDPADFIADLPEALRRIIRKACARDIEKRYRDIPALVQELIPLAKELGVPAPLPISGKKRMTTLLLLYEDHQQHDLDGLLEAFHAEIEAMGITLKAADLGDIG